jgi:hypothetical protein
MHDRRSETKLTQDLDTGPNVVRALRAALIANRVTRWQKQNLAVYFWKWCCVTPSMHRPVGTRFYLCILVRLLISVW